MSEEIQTTLSAVLADITVTLKEAASEYGPAAVDLSLLAIRVDAIQYLALGAAGAAIVATSVILYAKFWRFIGRKKDEERFFDSDDAIFARGLGFLPVAFVSAPAIFEGVFRLFSVVHWVAAFGRPELLIATNALKAAGILQ